MDAPEPEDCHAVVFDCNIYLDVARYLKPPFTWERFEDAASVGFIPTYVKSGLDSVIALSYMAQSEELIPGQPMHAWSSDWIEGAVAVMAQAAEDSDYPGLALSAADSDALFTEIVDKIVPAEHVRDVSIPRGPETLGRDDGLVVATSHAAGEDGNVRYIVTKDKPFRREFKALQSEGITTLYPHEFVNMVRDSRRVLGPKGPQPPSGLGPLH